MYEKNLRKAIVLLNEDKTQGEVINIIICDDRGLNGLILPENQIIWDCSQYDVNVGDKWLEGVFYRENEPVDPLLTPEQIEINYLKEQTNFLNSSTSTLESAILSLLDGGV